MRLQRAATTIVSGLVVVGLLWSSSAMAADNEVYGEIRWTSLPTSGSLSKTPWVGSWWAYKRDGSGYRVHNPPGATNGAIGGTYADNWDRWDARDAASLSPAEKYDSFVGRAELIDYEALIERAKKFQELDAEVAGLMEEQRSVIRRLNKAIAEHRDDPDFKWKDTEDGKRYEELVELIEEKEAIPEEVEVQVDTAFEYEVLSHGTAQFGVGSWYGHCNAWAAASIMEPEPRHDVELQDIPFTPSDVKAYLTEVYMEIQSDFYGSRNGYHDTEEARGEIDYRDVYPAAFHILVADLVGLRDKGLVIDRHTGDEVWNQPLRAFRSHVEPLYEVADGAAQPMKRDVTYTRYDHRGEPTPEERGEQEVYPILVTTTIHWMTDGLPADVLTDESINDEIDDETFADSWRIRDMWDDQVEIRTLTYELWLDRPMDDPEARIIGDGQWEHGSATGYSQLHPDFIWVPLANVNNYRDYENEYFDAKVITEQILPGMLAPQDDPTVEPQSVTAEGPVSIVDNAPGEGAVLTLDFPTEMEIHVLTVDVDITHTYIADLEITLTGPDGRKITLKEPWAGGGEDDIHETYDVKDFDGSNAAGTWTLMVSDHAHLDTGTLDGFSLHVK